MPPQPEAIVTSATRGVIKSNKTAIKQDLARSYLLQSILLQSKIDYRLNTTQSILLKSFWLAYSYGLLFLDKEEQLLPHFLPSSMQQIVLEGC